MIINTLFLVTLYFDNEGLDLDLVGQRPIRVVFQILLAYPLLYTSSCNLARAIACARAHTRASQSARAIDRTRK